MGTSLKEANVSVKKQWIRRVAVSCLVIGAALWGFSTVRADAPIPDCEPNSGNGGTVVCTINGDQEVIDALGYTGICSIVYEMQGQWAVEQRVKTIVLDKGDHLEEAQVVYEVVRPVNGGEILSSAEVPCPPPPEPAEPPYTGITLLPEDVALPYLGLPNDAGMMPCGVFDVNGWGRKYVGLADFPACTPPVEVLCLNDMGQWTGNEIHDVVLHGDYEVDFTSTQHGTCGIFPTG